MSNDAIHRLIGHPQRSDRAFAQSIAMLVDEVRERRHAYRALAANRRDARRFVFLDDRQRAAQLLKHDGLRFDAVALLQPDIAISTGTIAVGPSCSGSTASSTFVPTE